MPDSTSTPASSSATTSVNSLDACLPQSNATVSASAGSGKTWLLVTRMVRLLLDGAEPGKILALTFTRKAAGEMRLRLNSRLYDMAIANDGELAEQLRMIGCEASPDNMLQARKLYQQMMHCLYPVKIQTFHAFCQDILARFPLEANIPPGFELSEDTSSLRLQAWQTLFNQANQQPAGKHGKLAQHLDTIMSVCNGPDNTRTSLYSFLNQRNDWLAFTGAADDPVQYASQQLADALGVSTHHPAPDLDKDFEQLIDSPLTAFFTDEKNLAFSAFAGLLREQATVTAIRHADNIDNALQRLRTGESSTRQIFKQLAKSFITAAGTPLVKGRQHNNSLEKKLGLPGAERFMELHLSLAGDILEATEIIKQYFSLGFNHAWFYAGQCFLNIFEQLKRENRVLDFNDLEWQCYRLLRGQDNAHWVQYKLDQRVDHILIDEFQDTNPTQWQLLLPVLEEIAASDEQRTRSIFLVGDEKQSIYSFRRANPALQARASQWLAQHLGAIAAPLDSSRRSSPAIMKCVNDVFLQQDVQAIMNSFVEHGTTLTELAGEVEISELFEVDAETDQNNEQPAVSNESEQAEFRNSLLQPRDSSDITSRHLEAAHIAKRMTELVNGGHEILDKDKGCSRSISYGDIYLLMRNRSHMAIYEDALKAAGIPCLSSKKGSLLDNTEIQDIVCLLEILVLPFSNLSLTQCLKSPLFGASDDDLVMLASMGGSVYWFDRLLELNEPGPDKADPVSSDPVSSTPVSSTPAPPMQSASNQASPALQRAAELLHRWQDYAETLPVHDCLDKIFYEGELLARYRAACSSTSGNEQADNSNSIVENCRLMLSLALDADSGRYPGITHFLEHLRHLRQSADSPPGDAIVQAEQSRVQILTIHASKGLEAPVVFLADSNSPAKSDRAYSAYVDWPADSDLPRRMQLQLASELTDDNTRAQLESKKSAQWREELNLLYVAMTRARQRLYISGCANHGSNSSKPTWYRLIDAATADYEQHNDSKRQACRRYAFTSNSTKACSDTTSADQEKTGATGKQAAWPGTIADGGLDSRLLTALQTTLLKAPPANSIIAPSRQDTIPPAMALAARNNTHANTGSASTDADHSNTDRSDANSQADSETARCRGLIIHAALEQLCKAGLYPADSSQLAAGTSTYRLACRLHAEAMPANDALSGEQTRFIESCMAEALDCYNHPELSPVFNPAGSACAYNELPVLYRDENGITVSGIIDRLVIETNRILVVDYKSHRIESGVDTGTLAATFGQQLDYYAEAVTRLWPGPAISTSILFTHKKELVML